MSNTAYKGQVLPQSLNVNYISDLTGSGKTEYLIEEITKNVNKNNDLYIILTPNRVLCDEIYTRFFLKDEFVDDLACNIHQKTVINPSKEIKKLLKSKTHNVLITTHASFLLGVKSNKILNDWNLVLDEEMPLYKEHEINITATSKPIIDQTVSFKEYDSNFYSVEASNVLLWMNIASDLVNDSFINNHDYSNLVKYTMNDKFITLVSKHILEKFNETNEKLDNEGKSFSKFYAMSFLSMDFLKQFKSVLVVCSFFEKTISYKLFKQFGCNLTKKEIPTYFDKHPNSSKITLHYFFEKNWSTHLRKTKINRQKTIEELIYEKLTSLIGEKSFLFNANVSFRSKFSKGTLAVSTHGINRYKNYTELVFMPSLNATSSIISMLSNFGLNRETVDFSRNVLAAYQFVSRGAVRDLNNTKDVNIYVMDRRTIDFLKEVFPDAKVVYHETDIETGKKKSIPNNVKSFMSRVKKRLKNGESVRQKTIDKYNEYLQYYY